MKRTLFYAIAALATSLALVSCGETIKAEIGDQNPDEVLFSLADNGDGFFYVDPSATASIKIALIRPEGGEEVSYAISSKSSEELTIPSSVVFLDGTTKAKIEIGLPEKLEPMKKYDIELDLVGDNVAESASSLGSIHYEATIYTYEEMLMRTYFTSDLEAYNEATGLYKNLMFNYLGYFKSTFWLLPDNMFVWKNVLNSGYDMRFTCDEVKNVNKYYPVIDIRVPEELKPLYSDADVDEENYNWYYFAQYDKDWSYTKFYPKGRERYIDRLEIAYGQYTSGGEYYCYSAWSGSYFYLTTYLGYNGTSGYGYICFEKVTTWDDGTDYDEYPEIYVPDYPQPTEVTPQEGIVPLSCYMYESKTSSIYFDEQEGKLSTDSEGHPVLTIENFLNSGAKAIFTQKNEDKEMELFIEEGYEYNYEGTDYYYDERIYQPWEKNTDWQFGDFCFVYNPTYCKAEISESYIKVRLGCFADFFYDGVQVKDDTWGYLTLFYEEEGGEEES